MNQSTIAERCALIERRTAEVLGRDELPGLLASGEVLRHYIGFEISGRVHIGQGLLTMGKVRDFIAAGIDCSVFLADWHTWINDKLGGDRDAIRRVATGYFTDVMRAALLCTGGDPAAVRFVLASDFYAANPDYWATVVDVSKHTTLARMQRSISILGRSGGDSIDFAKLVYPAMQAADIFAQGVTIAHAGMDQRKAHVIARDAAPAMRLGALRDAEGRVRKPVAVHHPLVLGLGKPPVWPMPEGEQRELLSTMKMSKSNPASAVFLNDSADDIRRKVARAFCPPQEAGYNPVLNWVEHLVFGLGDTDLVADRTADHGGRAVFGSPAEVGEAYLSGALHPVDLKNALADRIVDRLEPARRYFADPAVAARHEDLLRLLEG